MILTKEISEQIAALRDDNTSGATALAHAAGEIMVRVVETSRDVPSAELRSKIIAAGKAIIAGQPAMATIYCLVNHALGALNESRTDEELRINIRERARRFMSRLKDASSAAARHAAAQITTGAVVLTHSRSSLIETALIEAACGGKTFSVICTESRPMGEGQMLAASLASKGIPASVVIDAAVASFVPRSTMVFVGADALSVHGLVNKIGTRQVAMAAEAAQVPLYVVATTHRFLPSTVPLSYQQLRNPRELIGERSRDGTGINLYFDHTPLDQLSGCITEEGVFSRDGLRDMLTRWRIDDTADLEACG